MPDESHLVQATLADRYAIERELGRGGMATVYLAQDRRYSRRVAVKVLRPELAVAVGAERFLREIDIAARLTHPHILPLLDSGSENGVLFYVMPYVEGETLRARLNRERQLSLEDTFQITGQIAAALSYAHSRGVVHRDVKPENILLSPGGAILADFGVARAVDALDEQGLTATGLAVGTPTYMSPEQASGRQVDARSDIYSLACVVYEMLGGEPPYTGPTPKAILARQLSGEVRPLAPIRTNVTPALDAILLRALDPTPADRHRSAVQFAQALAARGGGRFRGSLERMRSLTRPGPSRRALILSALGLVGIGLLMRFIVTPKLIGDTSGPATLVIFPFRESGTEAVSLGEGVADLMAAMLDGTVGMRVADPASAWGRLRNRDDATLRVPELHEARTVANEIGVSTFVLGSVTAAGGRVVVSARLYDQRGTPAATVRASVPAESLGAAVNRLALDVVSEVWERDSLPSVPEIDVFATDNIDAMKAYLEAKSLAYRGRYGEAGLAIDRAVSLDSTFALALLEQFNIRSWVQYLNGQPYTGLREIIDRAMRYRDRLSRRNQLRVEANRALDDTDGRTAASRFGQILEIDSLDLDALRGLAYAQLVYGWQLGKETRDVVAAYEKILAVDSLDPVANASLARLAMWTSDDQRLTRSLTRLALVDTLSAHAAGTLGAARALRASDAERDSVLRALAAQPTPIIMTVIRDLRSVQPVTAERFFAELMADSMPVFRQRIGRGARTQLWFAEGRLAANDSVVRSGALDEIRPVVNRFFVSALLADVGNDAAAERAVDELERYAPPESLAALLEERPDAWEAAWSVASYNASVGDTLRARVYQQAIAGLPQGDTPWDWRGSLIADIEARLAVRGGDLAGAEQNAATALDLWTIHSSNVLEAHPEPAMRFHLAEILRARGKTLRAARLYRSLGPPHTWAGFYTARSAFELAAIAEARGNLREAAFQYGVALSLWARGGQAVASWRRRAELGLQRAVERVG